MNPIVLAPLLKVGEQLIDRLLPDKNAQARERAAAERELRLAALQAEREIVTVLQQSDANQTEVNKVEAASTSLFRSGWRPSVGWVCSFAFALQFVVMPLGAWVAAFFGKVVTPPAIDAAQLTTILLGMLGLGAYRSFEKVKGVA